MKHVYFLVLPRLHVLDLAGPLQMLASLRELGLGEVEVECIGPQATVRTFQDARLSDVHPLPARLRRDAVLFVAGSKLEPSLFSSRPWREAAAWLAAQAGALDDGLRICGVCTGTFLLGDAGLLAGRACTTHHRFLKPLAQRFPAAHVVDNRVCVQDRHVWTSAGVAAGIDLALQLIADTFGDHVAAQVARENVVDFRRFSDDPTIPSPLRYRSHGNARVHALQDAISRNLARPVGRAVLAQAAGCSARHLARLFLDETGITIKRYETELRMGLARRLLTQSTLSLERIAERCGYASVQAFRANWNQCETVPPSMVRRAKPVDADRSSRSRPAIA